MKKMFLIAALAVASFSVKAQDESNTGFKFGIGATLAIPASNLTGASIGAGVDLLAKYGVSENFSITGDAGYTSIFPKGGGDNLGIIPVRVGVRFYAAPQFYLGAKGGVGFLSGGGSSTTATAYSFGAGYQFDEKFDVGASYDGYSKNGSFGLIGIRLGYTFGN